jgi:copper chaperone CopZ
MRTRIVGSFLLLLSSLAVEAATIEMKVYGLVCAFCAQGIEKALRQNPATADVLVSLEHQLVAVQTREGKDIPDEMLRKAIRDAGYDLKAIERTDRSVAEIRESLRSAQP